MIDGSLTYLLLAICLSACQSQTDAWELHGATAEQVAAIGGAMSEWCEATNGRHCATVSSDAPNRLYVTADQLPDGTDGHYGRRGDTGTIWLRDDLDAARLRSVTLHELGHHFGCRANTTGDNDIMNDFAGGPELTTADLDCVE